jgi:hypothetical protein
LEGLLVTVELRIPTPAPRRNQEILCGLARMVEIAGGI